jgi:TolB-like protein/Flp pilus assembly protein TadD
VISAVHRALSIEPQSRFETMREFAASLSTGERSTPPSMRILVAPQASAAKSVGVLPFENSSSDAENEYLADGIAEEIINALSKVRTLRVASRTTSFALKGKREDLQEVGRKLKVSTVLNGSVRRSGNRIRVTAELVNVSDGSQLWAERYDREMEDVFAIQDDIAEAIVRALRIILGDAERKALKAKTQDIRAYEYYLRGRQYSDLRKKSLTYALEMFKRAVEIDPDYASAHAGIADTLCVMYLLFHTRSGYVEEAQKFAERALALDPDLAEAHHARGMVYSCVRDYDRGNAEFATAMRLDPRFFETPYYWGRNLIWQGKPDEAIRVLRIAQVLRPESFDIGSMLSLAYSNAGKHAEAEAARLHSLKLIHERLELNPDDPRAWVLAATHYANNGDRQAAENAIDRALAIDDDALTFYNIACAHALLRDEDKAITYLEKAVAGGYHNKPWLTHDSDFDFVRDTPRFKRILESIEL